MDFRSPFQLRPFPDSLIYSILFFHSNLHLQHKRQWSRGLQLYFVNLFAKANQVKLLPCILLTYQMKGYTHLSIMLHQLLIGINLHYLWVKCPWVYSNTSAVDFISIMAVFQTHKQHWSAHAWHSTKNGVVLLMWSFGRVEKELRERTAFKKTITTE